VRAAWDLREALRAAIEARHRSAIGRSLGATKNQTARRIERMLRRLDRGEIDPNVANEILFSAIAKLRPNAAPLDMAPLARDLLEMDRTELDALLGPLLSGECERVVDASLVRPRRPSFGAAARTMQRMIERMMKEDRDPLWAHAARGSIIPLSAWHRASSDLPAEEAGSIAVLMMDAVDRIDRGDALDALRTSAADLMASIGDDPILRHRHTHPEALRTAIALFIHDAGGLDRARERWKADTAEIENLVESLAAAEDDAKARLDADAHFLSALRDRRLLLGARTATLIRVHLAAQYPDEGLGYLARDGDQLFFIPVKNRLRGTPEGRRQGEEDPIDRERVSKLLRFFDLDLVASVHSQPESPAVFSNIDLDGVKGAAAALPGFRVLIDGLVRTPGGFVHTLASFEARPDGQVAGEDVLVQ
jgi:proteasome lid subunit RPN8/RPN11